MIRPRCFLGAVLLFSSILPRGARAQEYIQSPDPSLPAPTEAQPGVASASLSGSQLASFAQLVGEPEYMVMRRLQWDPSLVPLAAQAADAYSFRNRAGWAMAIGGSALLAVGGMVGYLWMIAAMQKGPTCDDDACDSSATNALIKGAIIMGGSILLGLGAGIPGVLMIVYPGNFQNEVRSRYLNTHPRPDPPRPVPPTYMSGPASRPDWKLTFPLLSLRF